MKRSSAPILFVLFAIGCGSDQVPIYPVSGRVQFEDGEPVRLGTVELESLSYGTTATGKIQEDGSFELGTYPPSDGAAAGEHRATVVQIVIDDGTFQHTKDHGRKVPQRYSNYATARLLVDVSADTLNDVLLTLTTE